MVRSLNSLYCLHPSLVMDLREDSEFCKSWHHFSVENSMILDARRSKLRHPRSPILSVSKYMRATDEALPKRFSIHEEVAPRHRTKVQVHFSVLFFFRSPLSSASYLFPQSTVLVQLAPSLLPIFPLVPVVSANFLELLLQELFLPKMVCSSNLSVPQTGFTMDYY